MQPRKVEILYKKIVKIFPFQKMFFNSRVPKIIQDKEDMILCIKPLN